MNKEETTIGSWITFDNEATAEIMAGAGFDWLVLDMEHAPLGLEAASKLIRIIQLKGVPAYCRLPGNDANLIKNVLDAGATGIIVPTVESAEDARAIVANASYPPKGKRGVGLGRAQGYGASFEEYRKNIADGLAIIAMIETKKGVENVEAIAATVGITGLLVGPYDLSGSLGVIGQLTHPLVTESKQKILQAAKKAGIAVGLHVVHPEPDTVATAIKEGYRFIALGVDMIYLDQAAKKALSHARGLK